MKNVVIQSVSYAPLTDIEAQVLHVLRSRHISLAVSYVAETCDLTRTEAEYLIAHSANRAQGGDYAYSDTQKVFVVTDNEYDLIVSLYKLKEPQKIMAIKFLKGQYSLGLKEAKDICDAING